MEEFGEKEELHWEMKAFIRLCHQSLPVKHIKTHHKDVSVQTVCFHTKLLNSLKNIFTMLLLSSNLKKLLSSTNGSIDTKVLEHRCRYITKFGIDYSY